MVQRLSVAEMPGCGGPYTIRKLDRLIVVVLAWALGYFTIDSIVLEPQREALPQKENAAAAEQARHLGRLATAEAYQQSNELYLPALTIDANYAAAWNVPALNDANQRGMGWLPGEEGSGLVHKAAERALAIDPGDAKAHATLAYVAVYIHNDLPAAARPLARRIHVIH